MELIGGALDWLVELLRAQPVLLLFTLLALGYVIGGISVKGFSLGPVAGVLFAGIFFGHEGLRITPGAQAVGFALFIFSVGYQAGPRFFSALKADGLKYFVLSLVVALAAVMVALLAAQLLELKPGVAAGLLAGGLTSSPTLAAAQEAVREASVPLAEGFTADKVLSNIASAYAITYIFGLTGLITIIRYLPRILGIDLEAECRKLEASTAGSMKPVNITTRRYRVENPDFTSLTARELRDKYRNRAPVATVLREGRPVTVQGQEHLETGDVLELVAPREFFSAELQEIGTELPLDWDISEGQDTAVVVVTNKQAYGNTLGDLDIPNAFRVIIRRIIRQGVELPHSPDLELKKGDILHVVGGAEPLANFGAYMGHLEQDLNQTDMLTFAVGISMGVLLGLLSVSVGGLEIGLGNAGGLLAAGLAIGYLRSVRPTFGRLPEATSWWLMEFGLLLFMAGVGLQAGGSFIETLTRSGPLLVLAGIVITAVPILVAYMVGSRLLQLNPAILMGALTGAMTSGASLSVVTAEAKSAVPAIGYAGTYAFGNVLLMIAGPLVLLFG
jgi:putative transport protein